jgi:ferredoxin-nitrite reductase
MSSVLEKAFEDRSKKLNKIEELKLKRTPQETLNKLESYAKNGYESILKEDLDFFLKTFGIYDRSEPNSFMMRVRVPNGKLTSAQAKKIGEIAVKYGKDYIDITTRMQIQLRYLPIEAIPNVISELESVGISSYQTGIDNVRNIVSDPLNSVAKDSLFQTDEIVKKMNEIFLKKDEWLTVLPRKFNVGINGSFSNRSNIFGQDVAFVLAQKDGEFGFNLYLGGKVGVSAKKSDIFLKNEEEILAVFKAILILFKKYGFRDNRNKNRLHFLIEAVGMEEFEKAIKKECDMKLFSSGKSLVDFENFNNEIVALKNGRYAKLLVVPAGIFSGTSLIEVSNLIREIGGEIRFTYEQNIYIVDVEKEKLQQFEIVKKFSQFEHPYFKNMVACAGSKDCPFGVIENKLDAIEMANYLSNKVSSSKDSAVRFHWSACPKGCGIHGFGDIGFEGTKVKVDGKMEGGVHIFIGGKMGGDGREGYKLLKSITLINAKLFVSDIMRIYENMKLPYESFSKFEERVLSNYSPYAFEFLLRFNRAFPELSQLSIKEKPKSGKNELFEIFEFGIEIYRNVTGVSPYLETRNFTTSSIKKAKKIDHKFGDILQKMIEADFSKRYESFSEILVDMEKL